MVVVNVHVVDAVVMMIVASPVCVLLQALRDPTHFSEDTEYPLSVLSNNEEESFDNSEDEVVGSQGC
jgi:predicted component of viral defense system (DUF524 family)